MSFGGCSIFVPLMYLFLWLRHFFLGYPFPSKWWRKHLYIIFNVIFPPWNIVQLCRRMKTDLLQPSGLTPFLKSLHASCMNVYTLLIGYFQQLDYHKIRTWGFIVSCSCDMTLHISVLQRIGYISFCGVKILGSFSSDLWFNFWQYALQRSASPTSSADKISFSFSMVYVLNLKEDVNC